MSDVAAADDEVVEMQRVKRIRNAYRVNSINAVDVPEERQRVAAAVGRLLNSHSDEHLYRCTELLVPPHVLRAEAQSAKDMADAMSAFLHPERVGLEPQIYIHDCRFCPYPLGLRLSSRWSKLRQGVHEWLEDPLSSRGAFAAQLLIILVILLSTVSTIVETLPEAEDWVGWKQIYRAVAALFVFEYFARIFAAGTPLRWHRKVSNMIDVAAMISAVVDLFAHSDALSFLRLLRVVRLVRLIQMLTFFPRLHTYLRVIKATFVRAGGVFIALALYLALAVVFFSTLIFFAEKTAMTFDEATKSYRNADGSRAFFQSVPDTFYFCITTLTSVGYGDEVAKTTIGKVAASVMCIFGVFVLSVPTGITANFFGVALREEATRVASVEEALTNLHSQRRQLELALFELNRILFPDLHLSLPEPRLSAAADSAATSADDLAEASANAKSTAPLTGGAHAPAPAPALAPASPNALDQATLEPLTDFVPWRRGEAAQLKAAVDMHTTLVLEQLAQVAKFCRGLYSVRLRRISVGELAPGSHAIVGAAPRSKARRGPMTPELSKRSSV